MRLTFFVDSDLRVSRGTANVLFNLLKYMPNNIEITIIEPTNAYNNPLILSTSEVNELTKNCKIIRINSTPKTIKKDNNKIGIFYRRLIANPLIYTLKHIPQETFDKVIIAYSGYKTIKSLKHMPQETLDEIKDTDIVYLFYNQFAIFFSDTNIPVVGSEHLYAFNRVRTNRNKNIFNKIYFNLIYKIFYKNIWFIHLFNGREDTLKGLKQYFNFKLKEIMVLPVGVDTSLFYPDYNINNKKLKFLFVAALVEEKGLDLLLPLIEKINNDNIEFHIAGGGKLADKIKNNKKIIYHGLLNNEDLAKLYRQCDVFIYPSHMDTFSLVTLQALSSGLYVICSDYLRGNFDDFENKYLEYLPLDIEKWYSRVNEIINNNDIIKRDKNEEYLFVENNYDWKIISKKFYDYMIKFYNKQNEKNNA